MNKLKQIIKYIKNIFTKKEKVTNYEETIINIFDNIKPGDIIWARRYTSEKSKKRIPKGHREGPFIVVKNLGESLLCSQGTGVIPQEEYEDVNFFLDNIGYKLNKPTYFNMNKLKNISKDGFISNVDRLYDKTKDLFFKKIKQIHKGKYCNINLEISLNIGDIVLYNKNHYLILDDKDLTAVILNEIDNSKFSEFKNLDYSTVVSFKDKKELKYEDTVSSNVICYVLKKYKEYLKNNKEQKVTQRGSIILKDNKYYYIYGEEGKNWLVFELQKYVQKNYTQVEINKELFYTIYNDTIINKNDIFSLIYICDENKIDEIKRLRKTFKEENNKRLKLQKNNSNKLCYQTDEETIQVGTIIKCNDLSDEEFIVKSILGNVLICISNVDRVNTRRDYYINKEKAIIVKNKQKKK